ncbi:hypothetical protein OIU84_023119 [Salix udensis]|uniref:Uncharacterized protein n=1 Tax=Salix udensis TaxID=889485 RepID=A0AAD6PFG7_9ROSI|nr:hypothetical protein OIU84_023119 [Salix udensis]
MQNRRSQLQQHPDFHITSSTILASTLHITRLNTRNPGPVNAGMAPGHALRSGPDQAIPANGIGVPGLEQPLENDIRERVDNPMQNPGGASSEGFNSFLSIFRDMRDQGQVYAESPRTENRAAQDAQQ